MTIVDTEREREGEKRGGEREGSREKVAVKCLL